MRAGVILAGGGGTRLWPASRRSHPKPLLPLGNEGESLLAATYRRAQRSCDQVLVVTAADQAAGIREVLGDEVEILCEPCGRNTGVAVGLAAVWLLSRDPQATMAIFPADHHIGDEEAFAAVLDRALRAAEIDGRSIVTVGIVPTRVETGFGYLALGEAASEGLHRVDAFVEKPDRARAQAMVDGGRHLWNGGIFAARADHMLAEISRHMPKAASALATLKSALASGGRPALDAALPAAYEPLPSVSIDYGVLERTDRVLCVPGDFGWNDVGSWTALAEIQPADADGNVQRGELVALDAGGNIAVCDPGCVVTILGADDLVVVQSGNAVLVVPRSRAQEVRTVVDELTRRGLERFL